ncbi:protein-L-isoaspartate(D-aspartate) O-methyltransferase [Spongiactinospora rosea]|uniref:Protein-L-isoaspartate O-methyltransferase n=1 Tax=Spongiactinospora rosea TaxID=2248750 RepID=A0A366M605_9ACTN|nr:methyltransferase domain-containing protein [Spongiactinospora rosea]RBQ21636.1 protein-L-isoaspartate(D-aspartate) O-methyltransferase [Spongiactinospora rosea]
MTEARTDHRIDRLITALDPEGDISDSVKAAVRAVWRDQFIPPVGLIARPQPHLIDRDTDPDEWWDAVYSDTSIVTQLDDGATDLKTLSSGYTSSASAPSTVADLLQRLDLQAGHRVLEIGTGTGWTAALLSHLVGEQNVTSIEVDAAVAEQAAKNLSAAGHTPHLILGDGTQGAPDRAPHDRVHVTCGIRSVPYAWVEQTRPGGVIVAPWCPNFGTNHLVRLVVVPDGTAHGRFPGFASYMPLRSQRAVADRAAPSDECKHHFTTRVDPRTIAYAPAGADLAMAALTGLTSRSASGSDDDGELHRVWVSDPASAFSWAAAVWRPGAEEYKVYQVGDRPLWDEVVDAYFRWVAWGEPGRDRFGMTVTPDGQQVWLDTPEQVIG